MSNRIKRTTLAAVAAVAIVTGGAWGPALAAPITFNTALAISEDEWIFRQQIIFANVPDDPAGLGREFSALTSVSVLGYGLTPKLALFGIVPFSFKELELAGPDRSSQGIGDARIFARYTIYQKDAPGQTFRIAPFAGLELPTGDNNERDAFGRLPRPLQPGSGSWDPFGGVVVTYATTDWQVDGQVSYQINTEADGREDGDVFKADFSLQYRLWPSELTADTQGFLFGVLEANYIHEDKNQVNGVDNVNSGGTTLFLAPGLQYATTNWIAEAAIQLPVVQNLGGTRLEKDYIARVSLRLNF